MNGSTRPYIPGHAAATAIGVTGTTSGQSGAYFRAESTVERYREQEARLTRRLRWLTVTVAAGAAVIIYAISAGYGLHATAAIAGMLLCLGAAGQARTARNRIRQLLESGGAEQIAHRIAEAEASQRPVDVPLFSQQ